MINRLLIIGTFLLLMALPANSQNKLESVGQEGKWVVYKTIDSPLECGIMAEPDKSRHTRNGKSVKVNRGNIRLSISLIGENPSVKTTSYQAGFAIKKNTIVKVRISSSEFSLYLDPTGKFKQWAWPSHADDKRLVDSLRKGMTAVVSSTSERGTFVSDTFSLRGVTKGLLLAEKTCSK